MISSTLNWALKSEVGLYKRQIDSSVPDDWEYEEVLVLVEEYIEKLKAENETQQKALELQKCWIDNLEFQRTKLKQALTEIKEIAE